MGTLKVRLRKNDKVYFDEKFEGDDLPRIFGDITFLQYNESKEEALIDIQFPDYIGVSREEFLRKEFGPKAYKMILDYEESKENG